MSQQVELSEKQRSIVYSDESAIYVKASAGSGKTRVLTERVRYLLKQTNKKILTLTFTNKAGKEIKDRLYNISDLDKRTFIGTFHSFCQSVLESHGTLIGYDEMPHIFEDKSDHLALINQAIHQVPSYLASYKQKDKKEQGKFLERALDFISDAKRTLISKTEIEKRTNDENIILLYCSYQDILKSQNAIDFDDLLLSVYGLFVDYPNILALYQRSFFAICVDEAQDLNHAQYQLLKVLASGQLNNIMMVGDPNQSIFHFNGSSPDYMDKKFIHDFSPETILLTENYRSSISVLKAAKKIIPETEHIEGTVKKGIFELHKLQSEELEAKWVVSKIKQLIELKKNDDIEGDICFEKIAVLARNQYLFKPLQEELDNSKISYYYKMTLGGLKFESTIMKIFDLAFRVKLNPQDELHRIKLLAALSITDNNSLTLNEISNKVENVNERVIIELISNLMSDGSDFKKKLEECKSNISMSDENEKNMIFRDVDELLKHWYNYASKTDNQSLHQFKNSMALGQTHPLTQHHGVTLSTVHTMKGQEFDIVFIIGVDDQTFPDYRAIRNAGVELLQEKNNLYVAFTRSKRLLYVTWPEYRSMPWGELVQRKLSRFLKDI